MHPKRFNKGGSLLLCSMCVAAAFTCAIQAQELEILHTFQVSDGRFPQGVLVQAHGGTLYGTTHFGGASEADGGTVFSISTNGTFKKLVEFDNTIPGRRPRAGLVAAGPGIFLGTTYRLSSSSAASTIFSISTNGTFSSLAVLDPTNGWFVDAALTAAADGSYYGTASAGGSNSIGTVFRFQTNGTVTTMVTFNRLNGATPRARLLQASDFALYGTTESGGATNLGTVFRLTTNGVFSTLVSFNGTNGATPSAGVVEGPDGRLYGTTSAGGKWSKGTVFSLDTNGSLETLVSFDGTNGATPTAELLLGKDGIFYGTTWAGGESNQGTIFHLLPNRDVHTLVSFTGTNGSYPFVGLTLGADGALYGAAQRGDAFNAGNIYRLRLPSPAVADLSIKVTSPGNIVLSWPTNASGFTLEAVSAVNQPGSWFTVPEAPVVMGSNYFVTNSASGDARFYRLKR